MAQGFNKVFQRISRMHSSKLSKILNTRILIQRITYDESNRWLYFLQFNENKTVKAVWDMIKQMKFEFHRPIDTRCNNGIRIKQLFIIWGTGISWCYQSVTAGQICSSKNLISLVFGSCPRQDEIIYFEIAVTQKKKCKFLFAVSLFSLQIDIR